LVHILDEDVRGCQMSEGRLRDGSLDTLWSVSREPSL